MWSSSPRYKTALAASLAAHLILLICVSPFITATPTPLKKIEERFIELSFGQPEEAAPEPQPEPAPIVEPEAPKEEPIPVPVAKPRAAPKATPEPSAPPEVTSSVPNEDTNEEPSGAGVGLAGADPSLATGKEGSTAGSGKGVFDPRAKLSLYSLGSVVDVPKKANARKSFVTEQAGGAGVSVSAVNAGNHRQLGKVKKVFVGYLRKMHERLHKTWAEGALKDFEEIECTAAVSDVNLAVTLEVVLNADGGLEKATPIVSSGVTEFDVAAVGAFFDAAPFSKPPRFIHSYDGKVYIQWTLHRDNRQCGSTYAKAYILTNEATESATTQPTTQEYTEEEELLIAETEKALPTLPVSRGFAKEFVSAVSKMGESCKEKLKLLRDSIREEGLLRTLIREKLKAVIPPDVSEEGFVDFLKSFKPTPFCKGTPAYVFAEEPSKGPADELSFPVGQCDPSCRELCFTF